MSVIIAVELLFADHEIFLSTKSKVKKNDIQKFNTFWQIQVSVGNAQFLPRKS